jgi:hypothetical protein
MVVDVGFSGDWWWFDMLLRLLVVIQDCTNAACFNVPLEVGPAC